MSDDYRRGPWGPPDSAAGAEFTQLRAEAQLVQCQLCNQPVGQTCLNVHTKQPLEHQPAHIVRMLAHERKG